MLRIEENNDLAPRLTPRCLRSYAASFRADYSRRRERDSIGYPTCAAAILNGTEYATDARHGMNIRMDPGAKRLNPRRS